jgi:hypothetical protein
MSEKLTEHRLIIVAARRSTELPLSAVLRDGRIDVYPEVESEGLLFLQFQGVLISTEK